MFYEHEDLHEKLINVKMMRRSLEKQSRKDRSKQLSYYKLTRENVSVGDMERAELFAQQSIRYKNSSLRFLNLSLRMDIVESIIQSAIATNKMTSGIWELIKKVSKYHDLGMADTGKLERVLDDFSVYNAMATGAVESAGNGIVTHGEIREVTMLLKQCNDEIAITKVHAMPEISRGAIVHYESSERKKQFD